MTTQLLPDDLLWWQKGIIYQIYPRSFKDSNSDGIGDLEGIIEKLDYLAEKLGIDAIWLSPFFPSPMKDFGYDVANYTDVDPIFGDLKAFDQLVSEAHARNIKVVIDFVPNHSSDQHPWFIESRSSRNNPKRDWYTWRDSKPDGSPPNNWLSVFGGSAWQWDETTKQYYLHSFLSEQPDLNWRNPEVKAAMFDAIRFWLKRGVDGFRIDVAHFIMKDKLLRDNPPNPDTDSGPYKSMGPYDSQLHLYDKGDPDNHEIWREFRHLLDSYSPNQPRFSIGEIHIFDWTEWGTYYGTQLDELHMPFNFILIGAPWRADVFRSAVDSVEAALPAGAWPNYVLSNHDEHRVATRYGAAEARTAMMLLLTLRGTPTIYYGDEIGMHDGDIAPDQEQDPFGKRVPGQGRDPERTPMQWDSTANAAFSASDATPWLPVADDYQKNNVAVEMQQPTSMLAFTQMLIALRRSTPALYGGSYRAVQSAPANVFVYIRESGMQRYLIALNFSDAEQHLTLPDLGKGEVVLSTHSAKQQPVSLGSFSLPGNEGCIVKLD